MIAVILGIVVNVNAQQVVTDPGANTQLTVANEQLQVMNATTISLEQMQKEIQQAQKKAQFMRDLKSMQQLLRLIQNLVCTYHNLSFLIQLTGSMNYCNFNFQYNIAMLQLNAAIDLTYTVIRDGLSMDQSGRTANFKNAIDLFYSANQKFTSLSRAMIGYSMGMTVATGNYNSMSKLAGMRRYGPRR
jgi:hypothetical protein